MAKGRIIHIDGVDRTGKDTIKRLLVKDGKGNNLVIVRSFISQLVYAKINKRKIDKSFFIKNAYAALKRGEIFIVLQADYETLKKRFEATNEQDLRIDEIKYHKKIFDEVIDDLRNRKIKIYAVDSNKQPKEILQEIKSILLETDIKHCKQCSLVRFGNFEYKSVKKQVKNLFVVKFSNEIQKLQEYIDKTDITDYFITSLIKCKANHFKASDTHFKICSKNIKAEIEFYKPDRVIIAGNDAKTLFKRNIKYPIHKISNVYSPYAIEKLENFSEKEYLKTLKQSIL